MCFEQFCLLINIKGDNRLFMKIMVKYTVVKIYLKGDNNREKKIIFSYRSGALSVYDDA